MPALVFVTVRMQKYIFLNLHLYFVLFICASLIMYCVDIQVEVGMNAAIARNSCVNTGLFAFLQTTHTNAHIYTLPYTWICSCYAPANACCVYAVVHSTFGSQPWQHRKTEKINEEKHCSWALCVHKCTSKIINVQINEIKDLFAFNSVAQMLLVYACVSAQLTNGNFTLTKL